MTHCAAAYLSTCHQSSGATQAEQGRSPLPNLVVIKSTVLEVYKVCQDAAKHVTKLRLLTRQRLFGVVESLAVLKGSSSTSNSLTHEATHDALLLTFRDAKLSVLQWNASTCDLAPSSLHYFEGDESLKSGRKVFPRPPLVVTDPAGRCAAVVMFRHQLAVLPAVESETAALGVVGADEVNDYIYKGGGDSRGGDGVAASGGQRDKMSDEAFHRETKSMKSSDTVATVGNSYVDNLSKLGIRDVRDAVFLHNAAEPTLLLLHELNPTWSGNLRTQKDTLAVTALSLNIDAKRHPKIWSVHGLPYDATKLVAVPGAGVGGALVFTGSGILYVSPTHKTGIVLNSAALPSPLPPPPMVFDLSKETPGQTAARYAKENAMALHPDAASAALSFCDTRCAEWNLECCDAHLVWLDGSKALVALKSFPASEFGAAGALCILDVTKTGGGRIQLDIARVGVSPLLSCMTRLGTSSMAFLGSDKGNSLLVECQHNTNAEKVEGDDPLHRDAKRPKLNDDESIVTGKEEPADLLQEPDGVLIYGQDVYVDEGGLMVEPVDVGHAPRSSTSTRIQFKVLHSMDCMAPLRGLFQASAASGVAGDRGSIVSPSSSPSSQLPCLVACCGSGNLGGSLFVLHQTVLPDIITTVNLNGLNAAWAVGYQEPTGSGSRSFHAYLILSFPSATKVLTTGNELKEVTDAVEFAGDTPTIAAGSIDDGRFVVQAFPQGLRCIETVSGEMKHEVWAGQLTVGNGIPQLDTRTFVSVDINDPYVVARTSDGLILAFVAKAGSGMLKLIQCPHVVTSATCCSLYHDLGGWLSMKSDSWEVRHYCVVAYADGRCQFWRLPPADRACNTNADGGDLSMELAWQCAGLVEGASLLTPWVSGRFEDGIKRQEENYQSPAHPTSTRERRHVVEVTVHCPDISSGGQQGESGYELDAPVLIALTSDDCLLVYKGFWYDGVRPHGQPPPLNHHPLGQLRFKRVSIDAPPSLRLSRTSTPPSCPPNARLVRFDSLKGSHPCCGVFVTGEVPLWIIFGGDGNIWCHPCAIPGQSAIVTSFTPFHNVNCPHGFVITASETASQTAERSSSSPSSLLIAGLPRRLHLDGQWPQQKLALKSTPVRACYYPEARLIVVATAHRSTYKEFLPEEDQGLGGEPHATYSYALADATAKARGLLVCHRVQLLDPATKTMLSSYSMLPGEGVLAVEALHLKDSTTGSTVPVVVVGVGFAGAGEDYPCSGRVLVFEVSKDQTHGKALLWNLNLLYSREFKGPVTAVSAVDGLLLLATGNRLETCTLMSMTRKMESGPAGAGTGAEDAAEMALPETQTTYSLQRSAFYEGPSLVTSLSVVKSFALLGDIDNSVQFVRYKEDGKQLVLLGKDFGGGMVRSAELFIAGSSLYILAADGGGSLRCYTYAPGDASSWKGQKLKNWGVLHVGHGVGCMERLRVCGSTTGASGKPSLMYGVMYGTDEGGLGLLVPLPPTLPIDVPPSNDDGRGSNPNSNPSNPPPIDTLAMLVKLSKELVHSVAHPAGLNPGAFRRRYHKTPPLMGGARPYGAPLTLAGQGIMDVDLLMEFVMLPVTMQTRLAAKVGADRCHIVRALSYLYRVSWLS